MSDRPGWASRAVELVEIGSAAIAGGDPSLARDATLDAAAVSALAPPAREGSADEGAAAQPLQLPRGGDEEYVDARRLSVRPAPLVNIVLPQKEMEATGRSGKASLTIFIDDVGGVVRVRVDASDLPVEVNDAVRQAFYRAPFRPGQIDERAVKSMMRVEVVFETAKAASTADEHAPAI